ncbi:MAG: hypothetical protein K2N23_07925 [Clostridia bacterium]|nr:hypothetical protein [Clostridia bacterium]
MNKSVRLDFSFDRLVQTAEKLIDAHDYLGALKILNKNAELNEDLGYAHLLYAQIFDDIGLFERSINEWFKFLAYSDYKTEEDLSDAYEGLAVGFMNIGNDQFSAYYYNKLLGTSMDIGAEMRYDIMENFLSREENPLKFVYPPEIADYSSTISSGISLMKTGDFSKAIEEFEKVDSRNKEYVTAQNYVAMSYIIDDNCEKAEEVCRGILKIKPDDVHALTTLVAVKTEQKKHEESKQLAQKLLSLDIKSPDDIFKIATVCCENEMHEDAYNLLDKLDEKLPYDSSVLYFKAIAAFNCGKYDKCFAAFDRLLTVNPNAVTAKYFREAARIAVNNGDTTPMSYFYRLPQNERETSVKILAAMGSLTPAQIRKAFDEVDISDCVRWCFDESEGTNNSELQFLGALCAVRGGLDNLVSDILLNAFLEDELKIKVLTELGLRNEDRKASVVICNVLKDLQFKHLNLGRAKRKPFIQAYSTLTAHFALLDGKLSKKFAVSAENLYNRLEQEQRLSFVANSSELAAAILLNSKVKLPRLSKRNDICKYFRADGNEIFDIYGV